MQYDAKMLFSDDQAITVTAASTNVITLLELTKPFGFLGYANVDQGTTDKPTEIEVLVTEAFVASSTGGDLKVGLQVDDNAAFSSPKTVVESESIDEAVLVKGYRFKIPARFEEGTDEKYVRLYYTVEGAGSFTAGKIWAAVVAARQTA